jgi:predicted nucleotide-binding protein
VVFELGYFFGRLGRDRVVVFNKGGVEKPSDVEGIAYISYPTGSWKMELAREMTAAGFNVDLSKSP